MPKKTRRKIKPLKTGRKLLSWFSLDVTDKPLNKKQSMARQIFRILFGMAITASAVIANSFILTNHISMQNTDELFIDFYQFIVSLVVMTLIIVTCKLASTLPSLFRNLENIYDTCKYLKFHGN